MQLMAKLARPGQMVTALVGVCVVYYVLSLLLNPAGMKWSMNPLTALSPGNQSLLILGASGTLPVFRFGFWGSLLTANFLHGGLLHIVFNMMALRQIGPLAEQFYGPHRMLLIFLATGVAGFALSLAGGVPLTIGASGAICGLIGACLFYGKSRGGIHGEAVYRHTMGWVVSLVVIGFLLPGINNWGHAGGLLAGIASGFFLGYREMRPDRPWHAVVAAVCGLGTVAWLLWTGITAFAYRLGLGAFL